jgi:spermidine/putrescine transport system permease protein
MKSIIDRVKVKHQVRLIRPRSLIISTPIIIWLIFIVLIPIILMFIMSLRLKSGYDILNIFTLKNYLEFFKNDVYWKMLLKSFKMAFYVSIVAIIISYPLAYFISRHVKFSKNLFYMLIIIPLWVSYLVRLVAWRAILGNKGLINTILIKVGLIHVPLRFFLYNQFAVIIALTYIAIPFVFIPVYTALEKIPKNLLDASKDLGANEVQTFKRIILPLSMPGLLSGFMLSFVIALSDYIIPQQLGGSGGLMYGNIVWSQFGTVNNWPQGSALGFILFFVASIILIVSQRVGSSKGVLSE